MANERREEGNKGRKRIGEDNGTEAERTQ